MTTAMSHPRFRSDLVARPIEESGQRFVVDVTDPNTGETFRFLDVEYSIACAMDGRRTVSQLIDWAQDELGLRPPPGEIETVIATLDDLGYLDPMAALPSEMELGDAGFAGAGQAGQDLPTGVDLELGSAGVSELAPTAGGSLAVSDVALGMAGNESLEEPEPLAPAPLGTTAPAQEPVAAAPADSPWQPVPEDEGDELAIEELEEVPTNVLAGKTADDVVAATRSDPTGDIASLFSAPRGRQSDDAMDVTASASDFDDSEVSVDLTDHLSLGAADVKEAVRQSQIMQTAEPADANAVAERRPPLPAGPTTPALGLPTTTELPDKPPAVSKPVEPPGTKDRKGKAAGESKSHVGLLLVILLIVILGAGAFAYYEFIYKKGDAGAGSTTTDPDVENVTPEPPKPPPPPEATLAEAPGEAVEVKAAMTGYVAEIEGVDQPVEADAVVAKMTGYQRFEKEIASVEQRLQYYQGKLEAAQKSGNEGAIKAAQDKVTEKEEAIATARAELDKHQLAAPVAGTVRSEIKPNDAVKEGDVVFQVEGPSVLAATFEVPDGSAYSADGKVTLSAKSDPGKQASCEVVAVDGKQVVVTCAADAGLSAGEPALLGAQSK